MSDELIGLAGFAVGLLLIALGVPFAIALGLVGAVGFWVVNGWIGAEFVLGSTAFETLFPYTLSVIPLFLMMGVFATHCGLSRDLCRAANVLVGRLRGGLAVATIVACAGSGVICGSSLATVATVGRVSMPEMRAARYNDRLSAASTAAGGTLGVLIPPSILLIVYALLTEQSIGKLFIATLVPGLLATLLYALSVLVQIRLKPDLAGAIPPRRPARENLRDLGAGLAIGALGAGLVALSRGALSRKVLWVSATETIALTGMIFLITIGATLFIYFIETTGLPQFLINAIGSAGLGNDTVLLIIVAFYLVLGCFMDAVAMIFLTVPFIFPVVNALGFDPIWFGVLVVSVAEVGLITPPIGMNLFVLQGVVPGLGSGTVMRGVLPSLVADIIRVALLIAFPALALWLPGLGQ